VSFLEVRNEQIRTSGGAPLRTHAFGWRLGPVLER
jgi:hypothetical protein